VPVFNHRLVWILDKPQPPGGRTIADQRDYYEVLGVPRDADLKAIKDAFRKLALQYHPDRNKEPGAEDRFKEIAAAYAVLSDPKKRAEYDSRGFAGVADFSPEDLFSGINFEDIFGGFDFGLGGGGLFDRFFGGRRHAGAARGANVEVDLTVPLSRIVTGGEEEIRFTRPQICPVCHGSRAAPGSSPRKCEACGGSGRQTRQETRKEKQGNVLIQHVTICPVCGGSGEIIDKPCPACGGTGSALVEERLKVNIPVGAEEGMALRVPGKGMPSEVAGGPPGDLYVVVRSAPDPRFARDGPDLWRTETLSVADAALGTELTVPTLDATATARVPAGTQPDTVLRLKGKGLPEFGGRARGDLYLRLRVHVPEELTDAQKEVFERLRQLEKKGGKSFWR
jgi:DnaJ-class molecular chaperone with C-terminal Zn finger domain